MEGSEVDSRDYIVAYAIHGVHDLPADFRAGSVAPGFAAGVFLPGDTGKWFGRPGCPPRVVLLYPAEIWILPHPTSREEDLRIALGDLEAVESGRALLRGWLTFYFQGGKTTLRYNRRTKQPVEGFLAALRRVWLPAKPAVQADAPVLAGAAPDLKFHYEQELQLDSGEDVSLRFFQQARRIDSGWWILLRQRWNPANLVVVTNQRVLWSTDRIDGGYDRYGAVSRYAPLRSLSGMRFDAERGLLQLEFSAAAAWEIPVAAQQWDEARFFARNGNEFVRRRQGVAR